MKVDNQTLNSNQQNNVDEIGNISEDAQSLEKQSEFKISVRKLQIPVRPRGVLAE